MPKTLLTKWLFLCCFMVILMIFVGGLTRLTNSGLSIVEWRPISGILPPLNNEAWQDEFFKYQTSPEYHKINSNITLHEFKFIFWLEFIHRLLGRLTSLIYLLPLIYFYFNGKLSTNSLKIYFSVLLLLALQGFMGWYMVKSGLVHEPYVSHYRLAAHLTLAVIIYQLLFSRLMENHFDILLIADDTEFKMSRSLCSIIIIMIYIQIFLGALVAGLNAGLVYNSFPLMGNNFVPPEITININLSDPVYVQFLHRMCAYGLLIMTIGLVTYLMKLNNLKLRKVAFYIILILLFQISTGILTILYSVPIIIALIHQIFAIILLSCILWANFLIRNI